MRLIDADALERILSNAIGMMESVTKSLDMEDDKEFQMEIKAYTDILNGVKEQPTVEPERKKGKWIIHPKKIYTHLVCNKCLSNAPYDCKTNFCPSCGAEMENAYEGFD